jgi:secondary thiamine-phosphate synthase enzyme
MNSGTVWYQQTLKLPACARGCHLVTQQVIEILPDLGRLEIGLLHVFSQHTSASVTLNENADPDVRTDLEMSLSHIVPDGLPFRHTLEGRDDMPAHVKCSLFGVGLTIPITDGRLCLGTWQGIYLCEHRDAAPSRSLVLTALGQTK